jgi:type VI secretion system protein ImpG
LLISHWSLGYLSLTDVESIRTLLGLYNFPAFYDRQAARENELLGQALVQSQARPEERFHRGRPVRGLHVTLTLKEDHFGGSGRMFLFGRVVHEFLARYATMNSFVRLDLVGAEQGETQSWPARMGAQPLL